MSGFGYYSPGVRVDPLTMRNWGTTGFANAPVGAVAPPIGSSGIGGWGNNNNNTGNFEWGLNGPTLNMAFNGLSTLGNLWGGFQANRLARDQLNFAKQFANTNLNNQITSYNTALEDRANTRAVMEGRDQASADEYVARHRMTR